jgi:hypothetical protein
VSHSFRLEAKCFNQKGRFDDFKKNGEGIALISDKHTDFENIHDQIDDESQYEAEQRLSNNYADERVLSGGHAFLGLVMLV